LAPVGCDKVNESCGAAIKPGLASGKKVIGRKTGRSGEVQVNMRVNTAGKDVFVKSINNNSSFRISWY
jgi:hypothetical protein